jgi:hypothetical protein
MMFPDGAESGFVREGIARNASFVRAGRVDLVIHSMTTAGDLLFFVVKLRVSTMINGQVMAWVPQLILVTQTSKPAAQSGSGRHI